MADNIFKRWMSKRGQEIADSGAPLSEIAEMLAQIEAAPMDRYELGSPASINKITWQEAGRLTEPGRYMFKFGWLTVSADDLAIWRQFPNTTFTLVRTAKEVEDEYHLGTFELHGGRSRARLETTVRRADSAAARPPDCHAAGRRRLHYRPAEKGIRPAGMANGNRGAAAVQPRWSDDDGAHRRHEGA